MSSESENKTAPTKEEIKKRQEEISEYYKTQIPFLQVQKEYETLLADLEEIELRRLMIRMKAGQIMAPDPDESGQEETPKPRTLKKD
jgi:hypothetical protein